MQQLFNRSAGQAWRYFAEICAIPRGSGNEAQIADWLRRQAAARNWAVDADAAGNLVIRVPGKGSLKTAEPLILQGHMDMVCEKNEGVAHDFLCDPIQPVVTGDWLVAPETTLGADNGVALALALAAAEADVPARMPLELLFTVDEERGLTGAMQLDTSMLRGRRLLNLDSGDDGVFVIGCAGGVDLETRFPVISASTFKAWRVSVRGLRGGHSGADIHEGRGHALQIIGALCGAVPDLVLHAVHGGNKKNAIPREADMVFSASDIDLVRSAMEEILKPFRKLEPELWVDFEPTVATALIHGAPKDFLAAVPNGVIDWHEELPGVVRTSNSVGVANTDDVKLSLLAHGRSSDADRLSDLIARVEQLADKCGGRCSAENRYPGWQPCPEARLLDLAVTVYHEVFEKELKVTAIHAGLEAGIIGDKLETHELLSFGPLMEGLHAPGERLNIPSFDRVDSFLKALVSSEGV